MTISKSQVVWSVSVPGQNPKVKWRRQHGAKVEIIGDGDHGMVHKWNQNQNRTAGIVCFAVLS